MKNKNIKYIFWGSGPLAESSLYTLFSNGLTPTLVITSPDKKSGRHLSIERNIISIWCESKNIKCYQPEKLTLDNLINFLEENNIESDFDVSVVASYPKILKEEILSLPKHGTLNIHPSRLPAYRGPSPIQTALLNGDRETSISIIKLDRDVDHGPILIQKDINILEEDINEKLERRCGTIGAELLIEILPHYLDNTLSLIEQEHSKATFTRKFEKKEGEISLDDKAEILQNKYRAFLPHIPIFFFINKSYPEPFPKEREKIQNTIKQIRVKIISINLSRDFAENKSAKDIIEKVTPEGKSEMTWQDFERGYLK